MGERTGQRRRLARPDTIGARRSAWTGTGPPAAPRTALHRSRHRRHRDEGTTTQMRGIVSIAGYVPYRRLQRSAVARCSGAAAARAPARWPPTTRTPPPWAWRRPAWRSRPYPAPPRAPALVRHRHARLPRQDQRHRHPRRPAPAAPRCPPSTSAAPSGRGPGPCAPAWAPPGTGTTLVVLSDLRDGLPTSADESAGGDGAAAVVVGDDGAGPPVIAEYLGGASVSDEFLDRWRGAGRPPVQGVGGALRRDPLRAPRRRGLGVGAEGRRARRRGQSTTWRSPACTAGRSRSLAGKLGVARTPSGRRPHRVGGPDRGGPPRAGAGLACSSGPGPGEVVAVRGAGRRRRRPLVPDHRGPLVVGPVRAGGRRRSPPPPTCRYGKFLSWRGMVTPEPPRRPEPAAGLRLRRLAQRGVEVRLRGLPGPHQRRPSTSRRPGSR